MNVYQIGVEMTLSNGVSGVLGVIARDLMGLNRHISTAQQGLSRLRLGMIGAASIFAGVEVGKGLFDLVEHGAHLQHFETQMKAAGFSQVDVARAVGEAWHQANTTANASVSTTLMNIQHLTAITGNLGEALHSIGAFNQMSFALSSLKDDKLRGKYEGDELQTYNAARAMEMLGKTRDPATLEDGIQKMIRTVVAYRGLVDGSQMYTAMKNAGGMQAGWSDDFTFKYFPAMIQEMTAARAANAIYMMQRGFGKGQVSGVTADAGIKYGLWNESDKMFFNKRFVGMRPNSEKGAEELNENPYKWVGDVLLPLLKAHGMDTETKVMGALDELARNKTISQAMRLLAVDKLRQNIEKEAGNVEKVPNDAAGILEREDFSLAKKGFFTQLDNMLTALGRPMVEPAIQGMKALTSLFQSISQWASDNPEKIKLIGEVLGSLAVGAIAGGIVALGAAIVGLAGSVGLGIAALTAAGVAIWVFGKDIYALNPELLNSIGRSLGALGRMLMGIGEALKGLLTLNFGTFKEGLKDWWGGMSTFYKELYESLKQVDWKGLSISIGTRLAQFGTELMPAITDAMKSIGQLFSQAIAAIPGMVMDAISNMAKSIGAAISGALNGLRAYLPTWMGGTPTPTAATPGKQGMNTTGPTPGKQGAIVPPKASSNQMASAGNVYLDGDKVGRHVARNISNNSNQVGSASEFDGTRHMTPGDLAFG